MKNSTSFFFSQKYKEHFIVRQYHLFKNQFTFTLDTLADVSPKARRQSYSSSLSKLLFFAFLLTVISLDCFASNVDLSAVAHLESRNVPFVVGDGGKSLGKFQLSKAVISDFNKANKTNYSHLHAFHPSIAQKIANWYINIQAPKYLKHFKRKDTIENRIIVYNCGLKKSCFEQTPRITRKYIKDYKALCLKKS